MARRLNPSAALLWERLYPYALGTLGAWLGSGLMFAPIAVLLQEAGYDLKGVAGVLFNVALASSAVLFSVFVLAIAPGGGHLQKIAGTRVFAGFKSYVVQSMVLSVILGLLTAPLSSVATANIGSGVWGGHLPTFTVGFFVATALSFERVFRVFLIIISFDAGEGRSTSF